MDNTSWPSKWQRGLLDVLILAVIAASDGPTYGYKIVQGLEEGGFGRTMGGTLYPILARFEEEGLIVSNWGEGEGGPGRKFVQITSKGQSHVARLCDEWEVFERAVSDAFGRRESVELDRKVETV